MSYWLQVWQWCCRGAAWYIFLASLSILWAHIEIYRAASDLLPSSVQELSPTLAILIVWGLLPITGVALKKDRSRYTVATKVGLCFEPGSKSPMGTGQVNGDPEYIRSAVEESLKRLNTDTIDLWVCKRKSLSLFCLWFYFGWDTSFPAMVCLF